MRIGITAERRAEEQADLLRKRGADILHGPTVRVFSVVDDEALLATTADLAAHPPGNHPCMSVSGRGVSSR